MVSDVRLWDRNVRISFQSLEHLADTSRQDQIYLAANTVHLWGIELDRSRRCLDRCGGWLDEIERHRAARLVREDSRQYYVLSHGGLRVVLSMYLGVRPDRVALDRSSSGKPFLTKELRDRSAITFNLSHAHGRALIAISNAQEVGVDLECVRSDVEVAKLSERFFTRAEHTAIVQSSQERRATMFFRYWVAKEAVLKAQGIGLRGLTECEIVLGTGGVDAEAEVQLTSQAQQKLKVHLLSCEKGWEAAVAAPRLDCIKQCGLEQ